MPNFSSYTPRVLGYLTFYLGSIHLLYLLITLMAGRKIPAFAIIDIIALGSIVLVCKYFLGRNMFRITCLDGFVLLYILISLASFIIYLFPGAPASMVGFAYGLHLLIIPVALYFAVKRLSAPEQSVLLKRICYFHVFFMLYGFLMFYFQPAFFSAYLMDNLFAEQGVSEVWVMYSRVQSYFGSSAVGTLSWVTLLLTMLLNFRGWQRLALFAICIIAAMLSQQRGGIVGVILVLGYFFLLRRERLYRKVGLVVAGIAFITCVIGVFGAKFKDVLPFDLIEYTKVRMVDEIFFRNPFEERKVSMVKGFETISEYPLGAGVGATTSGADSAGANPGGQVSDANFLRIWADLGVPGIMVFILIMFFGLRSASRWKDPWPWLLVILIYCIQGLGSNVFDNFYVSHLFWLLLGVMDSHNIHCGSLVSPYIPLTKHAQPSGRSHNTVFNRKAI